MTGDHTTFQVFLTITLEIALDDVELLTGIPDRPSFVPRRTTLAKIYAQKFNISNLQEQAPLE